MPYMKSQYSWLFEMILFLMEWLFLSDSRDIADQLLLWINDAVMTLVACDSS